MEKYFTLSLIICVIGGITYLFLPSVKPVKDNSRELARWMFIIGLLIYLYKYNG